MLYRIDKNTMLDLPKWKCRDEFRDYYLAKLHHHKDVDLLAKLKARCDEVEERHKRWSEASRIKATRMWQRPGERDRVDWSQAIAVDVFNLDGTFVATFPSARKAAIGMFGEEGRKSNERNVRQCRMGLKKSLHGFMFRNHEEGVTAIEPYQRKPSGRKKGEHCNRRPGTFATQRVGEMLGGEVIREWKSVKECADTECGDIQERRRLGCNVGETHSGRTAGRCAYGGLQDDGYERCGERWRHFPSVSPVCGRNDGISALLDSAAISYGKWRTESLKAYGNAIVVQVMYEIFRAIEMVENEKKYH